MVCFLTLWIDNYQKQIAVEKKQKPILSCSNKNYFFSKLKVSPDKIISVKTFLKLSHTPTNNRNTNQTQTDCPQNCWFGKYQPNVKIYGKHSAWKSIYIFKIEAKMVSFL